MEDHPQALAALIREMPTKSRCDLSLLLADAAAFEAVSERLSRPFMPDGVELVIGLDAAGLPFAASVALRLGAGVVVLRREGKSAWNVRSGTCRDYTGQEKTLELVSDAVQPGQRCLVVDDWSETGAQLALAKRLLEASGAVVVGFSCVHVDAAARDHSDLTGCRLESAVVYDGPVDPPDGE